MGRGGGNGPRRKEGSKEACLCPSMARQDLEIQRERKGRGQGQRQGSGPSEFALRDGREAIQHHSAVKLRE